MLRNQDALSALIQALDDEVQKLDDEKKDFLEKFFYESKKLSTLFNEAKTFKDASFFETLRLLLSIINDAENWKKIAFTVELLNKLNETNIEQHEGAQKYLHSVLFVILNQALIKKSDITVMTLLDIQSDGQCYLGMGLVYFNHSFVVVNNKKKNLLDFVTDLQTTYNTAQELNLLPEFFTIMANGSPAVNTRTQDLVLWANMKQQPKIGNKRQNPDHDIVEIINTEQPKTTWQRFKNFMANHWKKILVCSLIGTLLVVAGVFTAGIVPMIAAGLGISVAAAAGIGFGGAAVIGGLAGAGVGAIAGAVPSQQESGVKGFLSRHKWKILGCGLLLTLVVGGILTGGIIAAVGIGAAGTALAAGVLTTAGAIGVPLSVTAATAIGTTVVTAGVVTATTSTGFVLGAIIDNKHSVNAEIDKPNNTIDREPPVFKPTKSSSKLFDENIEGPTIERSGYDSAFNPTQN